MLVIDAQQRDPLASTGPRQGRLEVGDPEISVKGLEFGHQAIGERSERPRLVLEPRRDRSDDIEAPPRVLEHEARDLPHLDIPGPGRMTKLQKRQRIGGGVDEDFVFVGQVLDERADPRRVPASLAAQTDRDPCHAVTPPTTRPRRASSSPSGPEPHRPAIVPPNLSGGQLNARRGRNRAHASEAGHDPIRWRLGSAGPQPRDAQTRYGSIMRGR